MKTIMNFKNYFTKNSKTHLEKEKKKILEYLYELQKLEASLWGINIVNLKNGEEKILEDTNHLIYIISKTQQNITNNNKNTKQSTKNINNIKNTNNIKNILESKDFKTFQKDIEIIRKDFMTLKKKIREKDKLKLLISNFTIKLIDFKNYNKFKKVFLFERMLYDVLDRQDEELSIFINDISKIKIDKIDQNDKKIDFFIDSLKQIRKILAGHIESHELFKEEREGYSNTSNIIFGLINIFETDIE